MPALCALAERHGLHMVEAAAEAHGATIVGRVRLGRAPKRPSKG
jgi:dTDP-4-amino-4,6-dideoxygalactose transaminase